MIDRERVIVAGILRPRGNRGELLATSLTDVPGRLESLRRARARLEDGTDIEIEIENAWPHKGAWVLKFSAVDSIDAAMRFRGAEVWVPASERGQLPAGEYFQSDLIGCTVIDDRSGKDIGEVRGFEEYGGPPLMEVGMGGREVLIPFIVPPCKVDLVRRSITVDLPDGLLDL